jgi:hypothetical protein
MATEDAVKRNEKCAWGQQHRPFGNGSSGRPYWLWVDVGVLVDPFIVPEVVVGGGVVDD